MNRYDPGLKGSLAFLVYAKFEFIIFYLIYLFQFGTILPEL
jgi:hypothetical protein